MAGNQFPLLTHQTATQCKCKKIRNKGNIEISERKKEALVCVWMILYTYVYEWFCTCMCMNYFVHVCVWMILYTYVYEWFCTHMCMNDFVHVCVWMILELLELPLDTGFSCTLHGGLFKGGRIRTRSVTGEYFIYFPPDFQRKVYRQELS